WRVTAVGLLPAVRISGEAKLVPRFWKTRIRPSPRSDETTSGVDELSMGPTATDELAAVVKGVCAVKLTEPTVLLLIRTRTPPPTPWESPPADTTRSGLPSGLMRPNARPVGVLRSTLMGVGLPKAPIPSPRSTLTS